jgi:hypothetical protein
LGLSPVSFDFFKKNRLRYDLHASLFVIFFLGFGGTTFVVPFPVLRCIFFMSTLTHFHSQVITVTNYTGEAREYLKKLISAMGAAFTPSMSGQNTALIAA